jgi:hypothetical protein
VIASHPHSTLRINHDSNDPAEIEVLGIQPPGAEEQRRAAAFPSGSLVLGHVTRLHNNEAAVRSDAAKDTPAIVMNAW